MTTTLKRQKSWREELRQSEARNVDLVKYVMHLEQLAKDVFHEAASQHEKMTLVLTPGSRQARESFAKICTHLAVVVQDADDIQIPEWLAKKLAKECRVNMMRVVEPEAKDAKETTATTITFDTGMKVEKKP